ncbi:hypothetical protein Vretimale_3458 [Volvox reticuliferus]|uniref:Uncharacterized protein n=1 Tax=Volvox reticuliferus TaxID=1737510 RepID=A0A8J4BVD9_9CHLO|nr:hypothetical protein Vretifemale_984 [Volvox reticuliferus]GIL98068.1 hypothetical protein Vretimale_3458 [Volvox reticuliferus]
MSNIIAVGNNGELSKEAAVAISNTPWERSNGAADPRNQRTLTRKAPASADGLSPTHKPASLPPGYRLVTVQIQGHCEPSVQNLPVEVLPCHSFVDLCTAALARLPDAPREYLLRAFIVVGDMEVPLEHPQTSVHDTLRSFSTTASLRFLLDPSVAGSEQAGAGRVVRVSRVTMAPRRQRRWLRRLARVAVGVAKFVLAVEAAALLRGGILGSLRRLTGRGGSGSDDGIALGSGTEAVMDAVADYVGGRGDLRVLERFDPRVVRRALEALDTEVLEQLEVPDAQSTRTAVSELLRQIQGKEQAATASPPRSAQAGSASSSELDVDQNAAARAGSGTVTSTADFDGQQVLDAPTTSSSSGSRLSPKASGAGEDSAPSSGLPGFGPSTVAAPEAARVSRTRSRGAGA